MEQRAYQARVRHCQPHAVRALLWQDLETDPQITQDCLALLFLLLLVLVLLLLLLCLTYSSDITGKCFFCTSLVFRSMKSKARYKCSESKPGNRIFFPLENAKQFYENK